MLTLDDLVFQGFQVRVIELKLQLEGPIRQAGIVKLSQKIARLCSKERTIEDLGLS